MTREQIYNDVRAMMAETFELEPERVTLSARLYEDLDLDSIDAVDLVVKLQELTGRKLKVDEFKSVRTVGDVIDRVHAVLAE